MFIIIWFSYLSNLSNLSVTWWRLFQKRVVCTKFDIFFIYSLLFVISFPCIWIDKTSLTPPLFKYIYHTRVLAIMYISVGYFRCGCFYDFSILFLYVFWMCGIICLSFYYWTTNRQKPATYTTTPIIKYNNNNVRHMNNVISRKNSIIYIK